MKSEEVTSLCFLGRPFVKRFALCYQTVVCPVCLSATLVHCGQTVRQVKMKLGTQVGHGPGHVVLKLNFVLNPAPSSPRGHTPPIFGPRLLLPNGCMNQDVTWYGGRPRHRRLCVRWGLALPPQKRAEPLHNFLPISIVAKQLDASKCQLVWR